MSHNCRPATPRTFPQSCFAISHATSSRRAIETQFPAVLTRYRHRNKLPGGRCNAWISAAIGTNLLGVTAAHGSLQPSGQISGGPLPRMVRGGHRHKPPEGRSNAWFFAAIRTRFLGVTVTHGSLHTWRHGLPPLCLHGSLEALRQTRGNNHRHKPSGGRRNLWFSAAIRTNLLGPLQRMVRYDAAGCPLLHV